MVRRSVSIMVVLAVFALSGSGCGASTGVAGGRVSLDGKPVVWGSVTLVDAAGVSHQGDIDPTGVYKVEGVPVGPVKVAVNSPKPRDENDPRSQGRGSAKVAAGNASLDDPREKFLASQGKTAVQAPPPPPPGAWFEIPEKFRDASTSGISLTFRKGGPLDIVLK